MKHVFLFVLISVSFWGCTNFEHLHNETSSYDFDYKLVDRAFIAYLKQDKKRLELLLKADTWLLEQQYILTPDEVLVVEQRIALIKALLRNL